MGLFRRKKKPSYSFTSFKYKSMPTPTLEQLTGPVSNDFMINFALMMPTQAFKEPPKSPKLSRWRRFLCFIGLHSWVNPGIGYYGPPHPRKCTRCKKLKWVSK